MVCIIETAIYGMRKRREECRTNTGLERVRYVILEQNVQQSGVTQIFSPNGASAVCSLLAAHMQPWLLAGDPSGTRDWEWGWVETLDLFLFFRGCRISDACSTWHGSTSSVVCSREVQKAWLLVGSPLMIDGMAGDGRRRSDLVGQGLNPCCASTSPSRVLAPDLPTSKAAMDRDWGERWESRDSGNDRSNLHHSSQGTSRRVRFLDARRIRL
ncbi:hypothetical protein K402DRAFT_234718 [Aulographum hederae CBS 113979]|uniref:Uncharacterized protein n=1 Tax=Aulographum hederae CBS 113979 TaxID=1176131 RepID=A0A6G1GL54_9PEZI|nr:hypothetical protein K402DRAFT_234718 [Aulographum hederae CBS 113979]